MRRTHWFGEEIHSRETTLRDIAAHLPVFERHGLGRNKFRDVIVRTGPAGALPVSVVSKRYALVQHAKVVQAVTAAIDNQGIDPGDVPTRLLISEYGTRVAIRATLPDTYPFTPSDGHKMALTFECFNSVDRAVPLMAAVGWFRFVCSNGMVVGTTTARARQRHVPSLNVEMICAVLADGMSAAMQDRQAFGIWRGTTILVPHLAEWVDGPVAEAWGPFAATRVFNIATTGCDGAPVRTQRPVAPSSRPTVASAVVPGIDAPCRDAYAVAQVLAWVASQRNDVAERLKWRAQIPHLMADLNKEAAAAR